MRIIVRPSAAPQNLLAERLQGADAEIGRLTADLEHHRKLQAEHSSMAKVRCDRYIRVCRPQLSTWQLALQHAHSLVANAVHHRQKVATTFRHDNDALCGVGVPPQVLEMTQSQLAELQERHFALQGDMLALQASSQDVSLHLRSSELERQQLSQAQVSGPTVLETR